MLQNLDRSSIGVLAVEDDHVWTPVADIIDLEHPLTSCSNEPATHFVLSV